MDFTDISWIFLIGASILPAIRQKLLEIARLRKLPINRRRSVDPP